MRARALCVAAMLWIAASGLGPTASSAQAEGAAPQRRIPRQPQAEPEQWWIHAREVLLENLELSAEQARGVDAILEGQLAARRRARDLQAELEAARERGDKERLATLRQELRTNRSQLRNPHVRIEQIRALLSPEQRTTFDTNRARLVAEGQQSRKARQAQPAKRPAAGADGNAE